MRWLRALGVLIAAGFLIVAAPAAAQTQGEDDRTFLTRFLEDALSDAGREVTIIGFQGALSSRATMESLTIADDDGIWLTIRGAVLDWNRAALLLGRIDINELAAREIVLERMPGRGPSTPSPEARDFSLPELPVSVQIGSVTAERVELGEALFGAAAVVRLEGSASLAEGEGEASLRIERIDGARGRLSLDGAYSNVTGVLSLGLRLSEGADGIAANLIGLPGTPEVDLTIAGVGPLDDFAADIFLATDGVERLDGRVTLVGEAEGIAPDAPGGAQRFSAEIGGDISPLLTPDFRPFFGPDSRLVVEGARHGDGRIELSELELRTEALSLRGRVLVGPDALPEFVDLRGRLEALDGNPVVLPFVSERTTVASGVVSLSFDAALSDDWGAEIEVRDFARTGMKVGLLRLEGSGRISRGEDAEGEPGAAIDAQLRFAAVRLEPADPALAEALGSDVSGSATVGWVQGAPADIETFTLSGEGFRLAGSGQAEGARLSGRVEARIDDLARLSGLADRPLSGSVSAWVAGEFAPLTGAFDLQTEIGGTDVAAGISELDALLEGSSDIFASVRRDTTGTSIRTLSVQARTLSVEAFGHITSRRSELTAALDFADLAVMGNGYGGVLRADAHLSQIGQAVTVSLEAGGTDLSVGQEAIDTALEGESRLSLRILREGLVTEVERATLNARGLTASAQGRVLEGASDLDAHVDISDLGIFGSRFGGALSAEARIWEVGPVQRIELSATGTNLAAGQAQLDGLLRGQSRLALSAAREGDAIDIERLTLDAPTLSARVSGRYEPGASQIAVSTELSDLGRMGAGFGGAASARADLTEEGTLRRLTMDATGRNLRVGQVQADTLLRGETRLELAATEQGGRIRVENLTLQNPQLSAEASASVDGAERRLDLAARIANLAVVAPGFSGPLSFGGTVTEALSANGEGGYRVDLTASGPGNIRLEVAGTVTPDMQTDLTIGGSVELAVTNQMLRTIFVQGLAEFDLRMQGEPGLGALSGQVRAPSFRVVAARDGITVENATATADIVAGQARLAASGNVARGGGFTGSGTVDLGRSLDLDLSLRLDEVRIVSPRLFQTSVSGDMFVRGPLLNGAMVSGNLQLGESEVRVPTAGLGGPGYVPPDIRHVNEPAAVRETRAHARLLESGGNGAARPLGLDLELSAPNRVFVRGRGLDAELGGSLLLGGTTADVIPSGEFSLIRGRLDLLGNRFTLSEGFASLQGQFVPFIRLVATTQSAGVLASVVVEGEATEPTISFVSVPELPEEEVVARLVFGRDLGSLSVFQAAQLASAIATLSGRGGEGLVGSLRRGFGLDDLDIATDDSGGTIVRAGRYLTENVYTDVSVDSEGRSEVSINLDITPSVTVRGRTGSDGRTGVGIFFERDY